MSILETIRSPKDIKNLPAQRLNELAAEIRALLVDVTAKNGGHLASNLGVVELTIALHRVFDSPTDRIIFDVSHQTYVHKLLTGRNGDVFLKIRMDGGCSGFSSPDESEHDAFVAGHAGTALSAALGLAYARDKIGDGTSNIIAVLGDASLSCGLTMEALNNMSATTKRLIIIVNDNKFSIGRSVGAIPLYLNKILRSKIYGATIGVLKKMLGSGKFGTSILRNARRLKRALKSLILPTSYFEYYGLRYFGPVDGHSIAQMEEIFEFCRHSKVPVLVHVKTVKGKGCAAAADFPEKFHGVEPAVALENCEKNADCEKNTASAKDTDYGEILGLQLAKLAECDVRIVGVVSAMARGTGLVHMRNKFPDRCLDVGIAEEHAVTFSAALAKGGMRPICAMYSTFLQRAFDQILHDVCLQNLPVIFCIDRAGISAHDGATHHGIFDISYLRPIPNAVILQPNGAQEFVDALHSALLWNCPTFIRYPKSCGRVVDASALKFSKFLGIGRADELVRGKEVCLIALGPMIDLARAVAAQLKSAGVNAGILNGRFAKPLDESALGKVFEDYEMVATIEDNVLSGGFGSAVLEFYLAAERNSSGVRKNRGTRKILRFGWPDKFIGHGSSIGSIMGKNGLSPSEIAGKIIGALSATEPHSRKISTANAGVGHFL
ncbi:MAG: 1-deoxy-D-xylulose-5-phosphate synthase [Puniceicoccales bacterium]|jgi:1-deoxy-D-xylulose-5-phosphate synthase|nr:1-deoxy-D-xylulose-5-phosphate synthase [Puniceicoccales bacterium]